MSLGWLKTGIVYFILVYALLGGVLVDVLELATWREMIWLWIGCLCGHLIGYSRGAFDAVLRLPLQDLRAHQERFPQDR